MASKKKGLRDQVRALEALAGLTPLDDADAQGVNGGIASGTATTSPLPPPKLRRGTGAVAVRRGTGAIAVRGTGAVAVFIGKGA